MLRRLLVNPFTTVILLTLIILDIRAVSRTHSTSGLVLGRHLHPAMVFGQHGVVYVNVATKEPAVVRLLDPDSNSWDEATRLLADHRAETASLTHAPRDDRTGFWALTTRRHDFEIRTSGGSSFSEDDWHTARAAFLRSVYGIEKASTPNMLRLAHENFSTSEPIWSGYFHNTLSFLCLVLFLNSLRWIPRTPAYFRARRGSFRIRRGLCPSCGYPISGLSANTCPECGHAITSGT